MNNTYYTYRVRIANNERVQVEKRGLDNQVMGEPNGRFGYNGKLQAKINELVTKGHQNELLDDEVVKDLGEALFDALFDDGLRQDFVTLYNQAIHNEGKFLRIELDVDEAAMPEVAALPWEFMCVPSKANLGVIWLGTAPKLVFSRRRSQWFVPRPIQLQSGEKLRIALAVAAPSDLGPVVYDKVEAGLQKLVGDQPDKFELLPVLTQANAPAIDGLLAQSPHIFHFIGHGRFHSEGDKEEGQLALVDDLFGEADWVDADFFAGLLNTHRPGVVVLHACEGGQLSSSKAFVGVASRVVQQNIPVVVAMQYEVTNNTALRFALRFYKGLAEGEPVDTAAQYGRRTIALNTKYRRRDFATPVLFMRVADGHLFDLEGASSGGSSTTTTTAGGNGPTAPTPGQTDVPLTQDVASIPDLISNNFNKDELRRLCEAVYIDIEEIGSSTKSGIAHDLYGKVDRLKRLDQLVRAIVDRRPELLDELKGNLYVFMEDLKEREVPQLCQELQLDCQALKLDKNGLLGYTANKYIRTERMKSLQDHMVQNGRYAELVQAVKTYLPRVDFTIFEM